MNTYGHLDSWDDDGDSYTPPYVAWRYLRGPRPDPAKLEAAFEETRRQLAEKYADPNRADPFGWRGK